MLHCGLVVTSPDAAQAAKLEHANVSNASLKPALQVIKAKSFFLQQNFVDKGAVSQTVISLN